LLLCACSGGGGKSSDIGPGGRSPDLSDVAPYALTGVHAAGLKDCALATASASVCTLDSLPLLGQEVVDPRVAEVMDRVLVSHRWMGVRFEQALIQLPPDLLTLFKGVTAIVIDSDIRPSFYSRNTAAIYLDPGYLWLTNEEKATIAKVDDYRQDYGAELQFVPLWRYVKDNDYAYDYYPLDGSATRQIEDILFPLARVLYHELAHANDILPPGTQENLDRLLTPRAAADAIENHSIAGHPNVITSLSFSMFPDLAQVLYAGQPASDWHKGMSAAFLGGSFENDVASDLYAYTSKYEDVAMLFEEVMMKYHFDVDRDIAFTDRPLVADPVCDDYRVQWGVRNRLGAAGVKDRAELVVANLLPGSDLAAFFAAFPLPITMAENQGWCRNLALGSPTSQSLSPNALAAARLSQPDRFKADRLAPEY
jgi:hypothetical protein